MKRLLFYIFILLFFSACGPNKGMLARQKMVAKKRAPSGKFRNPTMFSRANPFQGKAKARLSKSKKKKIKLIKRKRRQSGTYRTGRKPGRNFKMKKTVSRSRLKSSGSRMRSGGGSRKRNKNLFNTRKK